MMQQSSYHRYGDAPGLDRNPIPPDDGCAAETSDQIIHEPYGVLALFSMVLIGASVFAGGFSLLSKKSQPTQTACLLMER